MSNIFNLPEATGVSGNDYIYIASPTLGDRKIKAERFIGGDPVLITKNITQNGTYNAASDGAEGYSSVIVNCGSEITPIYSGLSYGYVAQNGEFFSSASNDNKMDVFEISSVDVFTIVLPANPNKNRGRVAFFANKNYSDFEEYILNSHSNTSLYTASDVILSSDGNLSLVYKAFVEASSGVLISVTNNMGDTSTKTILSTTSSN